MTRSLSSTGPLSMQWNRSYSFLSSVEPNFVERTALGSLKRCRSYSRWVNDAITSDRSVLTFLYFMPVSRLIARGARIGKTHTQTHRQNKYCNPRACAPRVNNILLVECFNIVGERKWRCRWSAVACADCNWCVALCVYSNKSLSCF